MRPLIPAVAALVCALALAGCGDATTTTATPTTATPTTDSTTSTPGSSSATNSAGAATVPITQRAVAAVAIEHLPTDTQTREATYTDEDPPTGALGADLRYADGDDQDDGDLLRVFLTPQASPTCDTDGEAVVECVARELDGGTLLLSWQTEEPEEDPGEVVVTFVRDDGSSTQVGWFGDVITGDPRQQDLTIPLEVMEEVAQDPRLTLQTSPDVVALGEALGHWDGGEPDPHAHDRVPSTDQGILFSFLLAHGGYSAYHEGTPSPLTQSWGPGAIGSRVLRDAGGDLPAATLDILASTSGPQWNGADPCAKYAVFVGGYCKAQGGGRYVAWVPGPQGEIWLLGVRDDEVVGIHETGFDVARDLPDVEVQSDWPFASHFLLDDTLGLTTDQDVLDFEP